MIPSDITKENIVSAIEETDKSIDLEKLILKYDKNKEIFGKRKITEKEAMELRSQFVSDFPPDKILDIEIDNYVEGKNFQIQMNRTEKLFVTG